MTRKLSSSQIAPVCGVVLMVATPSALAIDLHVQITSGGEAMVYVAPGATVDYEVVGELSNEPSEGLAYVLFDLTFSDVATTLSPVSAGPEMDSFTIPEGLTNPLPEGYGGAQQGNSLIQIGGAQNTISNLEAYAPYPLGPVTTGIAESGNPVVLATGSLTAPTTEAAYTLDVTSLHAAVIANGETGSGVVWEIERAEVGTRTNLIVVVQGIPSWPCLTNADCVIHSGHVCEWNACGNVVPGYCDPAIPTIYGDVTGTAINTAPNGAVNLTDVMCTLDAFGEGNLAACANADVAAADAGDCPNGNGVVNLSDILAVLDTFNAPTSPTAVFLCDCPLNPS